MRIPFAKPHRAFPELDRFTDEQCKAILKSVTRHHRLTYVLWSLLALAVWVMTSVALLWLNYVLVPKYFPQLFNSPYLIPLPVWQFFLVVLLPLLALHIVQSLGTQRMLRRWLTEARCPACTYSLLGLTPLDHHVQCPECGDRIDLRALRLDPASLNPLSPRSAPTPSPPGSSPPHPAPGPARSDTDPKAPSRSE